MTHLGRSKVLLIKTKYYYCNMSEILGGKKEELFL